MPLIGTASLRALVRVSREPCTVRNRSLPDTRSTATPINPPRRFTTSVHLCTVRISPQLHSPNMGRFPVRVPMVRRPQTRDTARLRLLLILRTSTDQSAALPDIHLKLSMLGSKRHHPRPTDSLFRKTVCTVKLRWYSHRPDSRFRYNRPIRELLQLSLVTPLRMHRTRPIPCSKDSIDRLVPHLRL